MSKLSEKLSLAKKVKNDEFYTYEVDIAKEMLHWFEHLRNKTIYLPYDTSESNFFKYFLKHKEHLNLNIIIGNNVEVGCQKDVDNLLKCDVVITNPPFSLLRKFEKLLENYNKKFIIIVPLNALANRDIFAKIKDNKYFVGNGIDHFYTPTNEKKHVTTFWLNNIENINLNFPKKKKCNFDIKAESNVFNYNGKKVLNMDSYSNIYYIKPNKYYAVPISILTVNWQKLGIKLLEILASVKIEGKSKFKRVLLTKGGE